MKKFLLSLIMFFLLANHGFSQCITSTSSAQLNINNINATINNAGSLWLSSGYLAHGQSQIYAGALWIGGVDAGKQLKLAAATYRQNGNDFSVGPILENGEPYSTGFDTVWVMYKSTIDSFNAGLFKDNIPHSIKCWPAQGNPNLPDLPIGTLLAPFVDVGGTGMYDPSKGDYPDVKGDEATWEVFNDLCSPHTESGGLPIGVQVNLMTYAYNTPGCLNNTTFYQYEIINTANTPLDSTYIGIFANPSVGANPNQYVGCDSLLNMGIGYIDDTMNPEPILGIQMINLPIYQNDSSISMAYFTYFNNNFSDTGNPVSPSQYYNYLTGTWPDGTPLTFGGYGHGGPERYRFAFPSSPPDLSPLAWSECTANNQPGDLRSLMSFGALNLPAGGVTSFTFAVLFDDTSAIQYPCPSFSSLVDMAQCVKESNVTGINTPTIEYNYISFYPNPMSSAGTFTFKINTVKEIKVFNILGQQVRDYTTVNGTTQQLQKGNLTSGIYFYSAITNNSKVKNGKIIVQ